MKVDFAFKKGYSACDIIDASNGEHLFELTWPKLIGTTCTMRDARGDVIAEYVYRGLEHDVLTFHGETKRVSDWFPRKSFLSRYYVLRRIVIVDFAADHVHLLVSSRRLTGPEGKEYMWTWRLNGSYKLVDTHSDEVVADSEAWSLLSPKKSISLELSPEVVPMLDAVVLSFSICTAELTIGE